ncbi:YdcF family protein [Candidatus Parcubacteria bacterium]|nr:YdcF family protein [Candidatus Parcubacteria bacterium]
MASQEPRPNLNQSKEYLDKVQSLITAKGELGEIHFEYLTDVLQALGVDVDLFGYITAEEVPAIVKDLIEQGFEKISSTELPEEIKKKVIRLWDHLAESDPVQEADLIFVFGGISINAVMEAVRLKNEGYAPKILFSGKHGSYMKGVQGLSEAEKYANLAKDNGVPESNILLEKESTNTPENIVNSAKLLHAENLLPKKIIAVSLPYHMKRAALTMLAGFDWDFELIRHPGPSAKYSRDTFYKDKSGWSYVCFEYIKLYMARKMGHF